MENSLSFRCNSQKHDQSQTTPARDYFPFHNQFFHSQDSIIESTRILKTAMFSDQFTQSSSWTKYLNPSHLIMPTTCHMHCFITVVKITERIPHVHSTKIPLINHHS